MAWGEEFTRSLGRWVVEVGNQNDLHAKATKTELAMGGLVEAMEVVNEDQPQNEAQPQTFELRKNGYLARTVGSGVYETTGLTSEASGGLELFGMQNREPLTREDIRNGLRQSSIDTEPHTLDLITVKNAKDEAVEILKSYDSEEALHLFLKDAEDEQLREEALAAILPTSELSVLT